MMLGAEGDNGWLQMGCILDNCFMIARWKTEETDANTQL